jgi:autoinducer 2-degrading protein
VPRVAGGSGTGAVVDEPGCLRFDVIQDANDANRIWFYEVYKDEAAFQAHPLAAGQRLEVKV